MQAIPQDSTAGRVLARLEGMPGLKLKDHGGYLKLNSPLRAGSDSQDFKLTIIDAEHGMWHDGPTGKGGSLYQLATELGVEAGRPRPAEPIDTKRAHAGLVEYAEAHGVPAEPYELAGWAEDVHGASGRRALAIPTETGIRWRLLDGEKPTYINPPGYARCWYGLKRAVDMAERRNSPLVLCNGEASTVAAQWHGVPACSMAGGGENTLPDNLLAELRSAWAGPIVVALDCDKAGREAAPKLAAQLRAAGYSAAPVDLGGANGFDLADFCRLYVEESYAVLCELARATQPAGKVLRANELTRLAAPEWLKRGWLVKRGINVMYGAPGLGKSFLVLDWACDLSERYTVLYVAAEDMGGYIPRLDAWQKHNKRDAPGLLFWPEEVNALDAAQVESFIAEIKPYKPDLVIFDTLMACLPGGNDSDASAMGLFIQMCHRVRREIGAAALAVHHTGKNGEYRGHSSLLGAADIFIRFEDKDGLKVVTAEKTKNGRPADPLRMRLVQITTDVLDNETGQPIVSCVPMPDERVDPVRDRELTPNQMRIMECICQHIFVGRGVPATTVIDATAIAKSSVYNSLSILRKKEFIEYVSGRSNNLQPTPKGRAAFLAQYRGRDSALAQHSPMSSSESSLEEDGAE